MAIRKAQAIWEGKLQSGKGVIELESGYQGQYSFKSRFEQGQGTNPEELIGAAHAGCFSMAFAHALEEKGYDPKQINTSASVSIEKTDEGFSITNIELNTQAQIPDISNDDFNTIAEDAKNNCPVSQALTGTNITLNAKLI